MTSEDSPQSPFEPGIEPLGLATQRPGEPGSPFAPPDEAGEHAAPRLGIAHLLVATACVAIYLGLAQTSRDLYADVADMAERTIADQGTWLMFAIGAGIALGGLPLWIARRRRGTPFPRYPGEYLLVVQAILSALGLGVGILWPVLYVALGEVAMYRFWSGIFFLYLVLRALVYLSAARWIAFRGWRRYFFLCAAAEMLGGFCVCGGPRSHTVSRVLYVLVSVVLVAIVVVEYRRGLRYPWTHWLGVGIRLWFMVLSVIYFAMIWLEAMYGPSG